MLGNDKSLFADGIAVGVLIAKSVTVVDGAIGAIGAIGAVVIVDVTITG